MKVTKNLFLVSFSVIDGGNEHSLYKVVFASDEKKARAKALQYAADFFFEGTARDEEDPDLFTSRDETRAIRLDDVEKTTVDGLVKSLLLK